MMKKILWKKVTAMACIAVMTLAMLAGCQKSDTGKETNSPSGNGNTNQGGVSKEEKKEPVKLHILNRVNAEVIVENNPVIKELEQKLNVEIEYEAPPINNYNDKLKIAMAGGDIPDIIYNWGGADVNYEQWAGDGLLAELDDKIQNYPNIMATIPQEHWDTMQSTKTGKIHGIPRANVDNYWGFVVNQQWLDNLGLKAPTNLSELKEVAHQFTYSDPDQNGKQDTFGFSATSADILPIKSAFGLVDAVKDTDGQHKIWRKKSGYLPYLTYLRELYADGSLDPEFFTNEYKVDTEKLLSGTAGMVMDHQVGVMARIKDIPDAIERFTYIGPPANDKGERNVYITPSIWGAWMISADADVDKCLELIDYAMSEEGFALMFLGIKGENYASYDYKTRMVERTEEQATALNSITSSYFTFTFAKEGASAVVENANTKEQLDKYYADLNAMKEAVTATRVPNIKAPLYTTFLADQPDLDAKVKELEIQYIVGEIELGVMEKFLEDTYFPAAEAMNAEYVQWMENYDAAN